MPLTSGNSPQPHLPPLTEDKFVIQMEVQDLADSPVIRVFDPGTQTTHYLSIEAVEKIHRMTPMVLRGTSEVNNARFIASHPSLKESLKSRVRSGQKRTLRQPNGEDVVLGGWLMSSEETEEAWQVMPREGEPKLVWGVGDHAGAGCGWSLTLHGSGTSAQGNGETVLGFAAWNDEEGIARLVNTLQDRQSVHVLAGVVDSASTARLSSRITALSLRRARKLPAIRLKGVRDALTAAGLAGLDGANQNVCARGRVLSIQIDEAGVPVAVAVIAPRRPTTCAPFPDDIQHLPWNERQQKIQAIEQEGRRVWLEKAKHTLAQAGWRLVDLPLPSNYYNSWRVRSMSNSNESDYFYVTRIKAEVWSEVAPAALNAAETINLNRSSVL
jgi:hypothetical protein